MNFPFKIELRLNYVSLMLVEMSMKRIQNFVSYNVSPNVQLIYIYLPRLHADTERLFIIPKEKKNKEGRKRSGMLKSHQHHRFHLNINLSDSASVCTQNIMPFCGKICLSTLGIISLALGSGYKFPLVGKQIFPQVRNIQFLNRINM